MMTSLCCHNDDEPDTCSAMTTPLSRRNDDEPNTCSATDEEKEEAELTTLAPSRLLFGSCTSQHHEQPLWPSIVSRNATAFVWCGDAVYADDRVHWEPRWGGGEGGGNDMLWSGLQKLIPPRRVIEGASPSYLKQLYQQQKLVPGYKTLLESGISIFGTIDDHDFGINNGDKSFRWKHENGMVFVHDFLGLQPESSVMAQRAAKGDGVYGVQLYDFSRPAGKQLLSDQEAGLDPDAVPVPQVSAEDVDKNSSSGNNNNKNRRVAVYVIDVRTNKTPWPKVNKFSFGGRREQKEEDHGDFLGETQWQWLEEALSRSTAAVNVIVLGFQVHSEFLVSGAIIENWSKFPKAQHRLYQALLQDNVQAPILVTGDVHFAELLRKDCRKWPIPGTFSTKTASPSKNEKVGPIMATRPLLEVTTSGMTHSWGSGQNVCGRSHLNPLCRISYYQRMCRPVMDFFFWITPRTEMLEVLQDNNNADSSDTRRRRGRKRKQYSLDLNFAEFDFDWNLEALTVRIFGTSAEMGPLLSQQWYFSELSGKSPMNEAMGIRSLVELDDYQALAEEWTARSILGDNHQQDSDDVWLCMNYRGPTPKLRFAFGAVVTGTFALVLVFLPLLILGTVLMYSWKRCRSGTKVTSIKS